MIMVILFSNVPTGMYTLQVNFMGYDTKSLKVELDKNGKMLVLKTILQ